jgi:MtaA/CmuA family methyltransferase
MTPRERAVATLKGKIPDRVPCLPLIDTSFAASLAGIPVGECYINPEAYAEALVATLQRHPDIDGVSINIGLSDTVILESETKNGVTQAKSKGGMTWMIPENDIGSVHKTEVVDLTDPRIETDDYLMEPCLRTLKAIPKSIREKYLINTTVTGPYSQIAFMLGINNLLLATIDTPEELELAIQKRVPFAYRWIEELATLDPGCIWIGEGFASNSLVNSETYKQFIMPYEKLVVKKIHSIGKEAILHICGKLHETLNILPETGADAIELDWQVNIPYAKKSIGDKMTLKGNLNTSELLNLSSDGVYEKARILIEQGKPGGRFILSSGCCLGRDTPPENVDALVRACEDFGAY